MPKKRTQPPRKVRARAPAKARRDDPADHPPRSRELAPRGRGAGKQPNPPADPGIVVALGASAGGLEAISTVLRHLPDDAGMAVLVIQHLSPTHESALTQMLGPEAKMPVVTVEDGIRLLPDHVYVMPANVQGRVEADGSLRLLPRPLDRSQYTPIDALLSSLAEAVQDRAVAVILSGTGRDGAAGIAEIKSLGGITIVQRPESARYDGMPRAAIATGYVDLVLEPQEIAEELVRFARHPRAHLAPAPPAKESADVVGVRVTPRDRVLALLHKATGVDFRHYKPATVDRRMQRRLVLHKLQTVEQYVKVLKDNPGEIEALYRDILIHVTRFFREPEAFEHLRTTVFPAILNGLGGEQAVRVWVCGCSTGQEAYSVAIVLLEALGERASAVPVQIFATDVSEEAIDRARDGIYPESIAADVSPERLRRFFHEVETGYQISKEIRDLCVFARHDVNRDPPFSRLDLLVCRNVLIYLDGGLQQRLMGVFHYALKPGGFLMLGNAESIGLHSDLFDIIDKRSRLYQKKAVSSPAARISLEYTPNSALPVRKPSPDVREGGRLLQQEVDRLIQERYAPPAVVVTDNMQIVQFRGRTGPFLEPAPGDATFNLFKMAREGLLHGLRSALQEVRQRNMAVRREGLRVHSEDGWRDVVLELVPLHGDPPHFLVLFGNPPPVNRASKPGRAKAGRRAAESRDLHIERLQQELANSREYLQSIVQELEAANEQLQSANEEVLSSNEELQSTNEELDTAKEELQSTNEELHTLNEELHGRNEELSRVNSDLVNLLASVQIAIVIVSVDLQIRRFTPMAERVLNLIGADVGRPIGHIKPNIECNDLEEMIRESIDQVVPKEREVQDRQGTWYALRIRPYKDMANKIDGAVLALFDIDIAKRHEQAQRRALDYADAIVETVRHPLAVLDPELRLRRVNRAFCDTFGVAAADVAGRRLADIGEAELASPELLARLRQVLAGERLESFVVGHVPPSDGQRALIVNARRFEVLEQRDANILLAIEEATARRHG